MPKLQKSLILNVLYVREKKTVFLHLSYLYPSVWRTVPEPQICIEMNHLNMEGTEESHDTDTSPCKGLVTKTIGSDRAKGLPESIISCLVLWRYIFMDINIVIPLIYSTTLEIMILLVPEELGTAGHSCSAHAVWYSS